MEIYYSPKAQEDLLHIRESIRETWDDEKLAVKVIGRIANTIRILNEKQDYMRILFGITEITD